MFALGSYLYVTVVKIIFKIDKVYPPPPLSIFLSKLSNLIFLFKIKMYWIVFNHIKNWEEKNKKEVINQYLINENQ